MYLPRVLFLVFACLLCSRTASLAQGRPAQAPAETAWPRDCTGDSKVLPRGATRIYIALRNGKDGSGTTAADARDGSTAEAFDSILRCYSEGCGGSSNRTRSVPRTENLIVCLGPGTFETLGSYDFIPGVPHTSGKGFTLGDGWKVHGSGQDKTTVRLSRYLVPSEARNPRAVPLDNATGLVFGTNSDDAHDVEISDLAIDANYPELKAKSRQEGIRALTLEAIWLRSGRGGHWVHNVTVSNVAGETGGIDIKWEAFHVLIISMHNPSPSQSTGNLVENVSMRQAYGSSGCGIIIANGTGEVRHSQVDGYPIGYGGWKMGDVFFHENTATNTEYGFNIDSWDNNGVRIESNVVLHPRKYGIVVGGEQAFTNFRILNNTIRMDKSGIVGLMFRGNVTHAMVAGNQILAENGAGARSVAIRNYSVSRRAGANQDNSYQQNQISSGLKVIFDAPSQRSQSCAFSNRDERGRPLRDLPDSRSNPCADVPVPKGAAIAPGALSAGPGSYLQ